MMRMALFCLALMLAAPLASAQEKYLDIALAEDHVDITTGFNGTRVVLFGTTNDTGGDIAVTLKGPDSTVIVRQKGRALRAWVNRASMEFRRVPSYYDYAVRFSGTPDAAMLASHQIGVDNLAFYPEDADEDPAEVSLYRDALIRRMQQKGFYTIRAGAPEFVRPGFFKVAFDLPPGVPTGVYAVEAMLLSGADVIDSETRTIQVGQVGFNADIYLLAADHALIYALFSVLIAGLSGWAAFTFLRRD